MSELTAKGMTFITPENGLQLDAFRDSVSAQIRQDFPSWEPYMARIAEVQ